MLKNERLLLIVDKPLTRSPELHEDNDDFTFTKGGTGNINCAVLLSPKVKILMNNFNMKCYKIQYSC